MSGSKLEEVGPELPKIVQKESTCDVQQPEPRRRAWYYVGLR